MLNALTHRISCFALSALFPALAFSDIPDLDRYSDSEHWNNADVVAFVAIKSGSYLDGVGVDLVAEPLSMLKGSLPEDIEIRVRFPSMSYPDRLGSAYMVFLREVEDGVYELMREMHSSISVLPADIDSEPEIRRFAPRHSDQPIDWYSYGGSLWIIECTTDRGYGSFCEGARSLAGLALAEAGGVRGR